MRRGLGVPFLDGERVRDGEPVPVHLEVRRAVDGLGQEQQLQKAGHQHRPPKHGPGIEGKIELKE